jgi:hypothetical protein
VRYCISCDQEKPTKDPDAAKGLVYGRGMEWWCGDCYREYHKDALKFMRAYYGRVQGRVRMVSI